MPTNSCEWLLNGTNLVDPMHSLKKKTIRESIRGNVPTRIAPARDKGFAHGYCVTYCGSIAYASGDLLLAGFMSCCLNFVCADESPIPQAEGSPSTPAPYIQRRAGCDPLPYQIGMWNICQQVAEQKKKENIIASSSFGDRSRYLALS